jgi:hypothetical protein
VHASCAVTLLPQIGVLLHSPDRVCTVGLHCEDAFAVKYLRLVLCVTPEHVGATGLEIPGSNQDYIAVLDPGSPLHLASYAADSVGSV